MSASTAASDGVTRRGDDRVAAGDLARFFNSPFLSDVTLIVAGRSYPAHKLVLVKASVVFERMFSPDWSRATTQILELVEESICEDVFEVFLRFLYSNEVLLHADLALPLLILADKYNVASLQEVCVSFVLDEVLTGMNEREIFHVWFQYSLKANHERLLHRCVRALAECMKSIIHSDDWLEEFTGLEKEQLLALLKCNDLKVKEELDLWHAVVRWIHSCPDRLAAAGDLLADLAPHIHFAMMTPAQLNEIEGDPFVRQHQELLDPLIRLAYKYHALPLSLRCSSAAFVAEAGPQLLARFYSEVRWERRLVVSHFGSLVPGTEVAYRFNTRACAVPPSFWDWELKLFPRGTQQAPGEPRCQLVGVSVLLDSQARAVDFLLAVVRGARVVEAVAGRRTVTRAKPAVDVDFARLAPAAEDSLENDCLALQLMIRPAE